MLSHQSPQDQPIEAKSLSTLDLYKPLPSDDEEDDFEYKQDDVEVETGDDEVEEEGEKQDEVQEEEQEDFEVPEDEVHDIVRVKEELYGSSSIAEKRSFPGTYREPRFVDADFDDEDEDDEEYFDEEDDIDETEEEDECDEEEEDTQIDYEGDEMVMEEEVNDNIVNFGQTAGPQTAKNLLLKKGKVLRSKQLDPEPFEDLLQARITSLLNPEA